MKKHIFLQLSTLIFFLFFGCKEEVINPFDEAYGFYNGLSYDPRVYSNERANVCLGWEMELRDLGNNDIVMFVYCKEGDPNTLKKSKFVNLKIGTTLQNSVMIDFNHGGSSPWEIKYGLFDSKNKQIGFIGKQRINYTKSYIDEMYFYIPQVISITGDTLIRYFGKKQFKEVQL
jgi:hypothetical protein